MIRPVSIQHTDLSHCRIAFFLIPEIIPYKEEVRLCHRKAKAVIERIKLPLSHNRKAGKRLHVRRFRIILLQGFGLLLVGFPGIHRVDNICLDPGEFFIGNLPGQDIGFRRPDHRALSRIKELYALDRRVCSLVKLAGERFHGKDYGVFSCRELFPVQDIHGRLGKDTPAGLLKHFIRNILHIVADQVPYIFYATYAEKPFDITELLSGSDGIGLLFFNIYPSYRILTVC